MGGDISGPNGGSELLKLCLFCADGLHILSTVRTSVTAEHSQWTGDYGSGKLYTHEIFLMA